MKKRKYNIELLDKIKNGERTVIYEGVKVLVKPIPEGGELGLMDPRLYKSMKMMMFFIKFIPKQILNKKTTLESILPFRKMFNKVKSIEIANDGIVTKWFTVDSTDGHKVNVRCYERANGGNNLPIYVYYHGGGYFGGSPDVVEQMCKLVVQNVDCIAFNIEYRLCPENHYPQPFEDCFLATKYIYDNAAKFGGDKAKICISGDSAGGNMAASISMKDRTEGLNMIALQALLYPVTNLSQKHAKFYCNNDKSKFSVSEKHKKVIWDTLSMMDKLMNGNDNANMLENIYLQGFTQTDDIYVSPILGDLTKMPPTMLIFGEHDNLVFDNFAYAKCLTDAKVPLKTVVYSGVGHGFADQVGVMPQAEDCMREIANFIKDNLA